MTNLFDVAEYPERVPAELVAGDYWAWKRPALATPYPPASYGITYELRRQADAPVDAVTLTADGGSGEWRVEVSIAESAAVEPGTYTWSEFATRTADSERRRLATGTVLVRPDPAKDSSDQRTHARRMLDRLERTLEGLAGTRLASITIEGRTYTRRDITALRADRAAYKAEVDRELEAQRLEEGGRRVGRVLTRL